MHSLIDTAGERIASGLKRKSVTTCSSWTMIYRVMGKPFPGKWEFTHHPWALGMHDCTPKGRGIGQKSAQMAFTETGLNKVFYKIDIHGISCLYILPASKPDSSDFSTSRFDPALELSPHLDNLFSDVKNIGHKRAGSASLYLRGSRSRNQLKSIPAGLIIFDEVDEMVQKNIFLADERASGQHEEDVEEWYFSTPTVDGFGINGLFEHSTQGHYVFQCPHCSRFTELVFPECLTVIGDSEHDTRIQESFIFCKECRHPLDHSTKTEWLKEKKMGGNAHWVSSFTNRMDDGFYINQLYSMMVHPWKIARLKFQSETSPEAEQELWNSKGGLPHIVKGAKLSLAQIDSCISNHKKTSASGVGEFVTMGVDVGKHLHYEIDKWTLNAFNTSPDINLRSMATVLDEGTLEHFEELDALILNFGVIFTVIDANPERRKALEFAQRFWGRVRMCFYARGISGKNITDKDEEHIILVDRTSWMDLGLGRVRRGHIQYPIDLSIDYKKHLQEPVRVYQKDADGNPIGRYVTRENVPDHFAHARVYAEIALPLGVKLSTSQDMGSIL